MVTAALGALVYALLGDLAELFFNCTFYIMQFVMLGKECPTSFVDAGDEHTINMSSCSYVPEKGLMSNINFLNTSGISALSQIDNLVQKFINYVWYFGFAILIICSLAQMAKVISGERQGSGAWLSSLLRVSLTIGVYWYWYTIVGSILNIFSSALNASIGLAAHQLRSAANPTAADIFGFGAGVNSIAGIADSSPGMFLFAVLLCFSMGSAVIRASFTYIERYFSTAFYIYMSPIAVALNANESTASAFKDWLMGLVPQFLGLLISILFMLMGFTFVNALDGTQTMREIIYALSLGIVFLGFSSNSEKFFNSIGIKTMQHGDAARSALAGMGAMMIAARGAFGLAGKLGNTAPAKRIDGHINAATGQTAANVLGKLNESTGGKIPGLRNFVKQTKPDGTPLTNKSDRQLYQHQNADGTPVHPEYAKFNRDSALIAQNDREKSNKANATTVAAAGGAAGVTAAGGSESSGRGTVHNRPSSFQQSEGGSASQQQVESVTQELNNAAARGLVSSVSSTNASAKQKAEAAAKYESLTGVSERSMQRLGDAVISARPEIATSMATAYGGTAQNFRSVGASTGDNQSVMLTTGTVTTANGDRDVTVASTRSGAVLQPGTVMEDRNGNYWRAVDNPAVPGEVEKCDKKVFNEGQVHLAPDTTNVNSNGYPTQVVPYADLGNDEKTMTVAGALTFANSIMKSNDDVHLQPQPVPVSIDAVVPDSSQNPNDALGRRTDTFADTVNKNVADILSSGEGNPDDTFILTTIQAILKNDSEIENADQIAAALAERGVGIDENVNKLIGMISGENAGAQEYPAEDIDEE